MKILMVAPEPVVIPRGTPISVYQRLYGLSKLVYQVDLLTYHLGSDVDLPGVSVFRIPNIWFIKHVKAGPSWAKLLLDIILFVFLFFRLASKRCDVIHSHEEAALVGLVGLLGDLVDPLLRGTGHPAKSTALLTLHALLVLSLVWWLAQGLGLPGVALALLIATLITQALAATYLKQTAPSAASGLTQPLLTLGMQTIICTAIAYAVYALIPSFLGLITAAVAAIGGTGLLLLIIDRRFSLGIVSDLLSLFPQILDLFPMLKQKRYVNFRHSN